MDFSLLYIPHDILPKSSFLNFLHMFILKMVQGKKESCRKCFSFKKKRFIAAFSEPSIFWRRFPQQNPTLNKSFIVTSVYYYIGELREREKPQSVATPLRDSVKSGRTWYFVCSYRKSKVFRLWNVCAVYVSCKCHWFSTKLHNRRC